MKHRVRVYGPSLTGFGLRLAAGLWLLAQIGGANRAGATPLTGTHVFSRPLDAGVAISVQAILGADSDTALIPLFVGQVDLISSGGGAISRTNDWLYYQPPASPVVTDTFH